MAGVLEEGRVYCGIAKHMEPSCVDENVLYTAKRPSHNTISITVRPITDTVRDSPPGRVRPPSGSGLTGAADAVPAPPPAPSSARTRAPHTCSPRTSPRPPRPPRTACPALPPRAPPKTGAGRARHARPGLRRCALRVREQERGEVVQGRRVRVRVPPGRQGHGEPLEGAACGGTDARIVRGREGGGCRAGGAEEQDAQGGDVAREEC